MVVDALEAAIAKVLDRQEAASAAYPSSQVGDGLRLHVFNDTHGWEVWLNVERDFDGFCLAVGRTEHAAIAEARHRVLALQGILGKRLIEVL